MNYPEGADRSIAILRGNRYMALATYDQAGPWVAVVAYVPVAPNYLYFVSRNCSRHGTAVLTEPKVSGVIYDSTVDLENADSIQFSGDCQETDGEESLLRRFLERTASQLADPVEVELAAFRANDEFRLYEITVRQAYVLDQRAWVEEGIDTRESVDVARLFAAAESDYAS